MRWKLVTGPATEPVPPEEAEAHCRAQGLGDLAYISGLVTKARRVLEWETGRQLITATWGACLDEFPGEIEILEKWPVQKINSIVYTDVDGNQQTLSASNYQVDLESQNSPCRIKPAYGTSWPSTRPDTYNAAVVNLDAGYGDGRENVPEEAKHVILLMVSEMYSVREPVSDRRISKVPARTIDSLLAMLDRGIYG
jgi:uncharacterized phiE125 gp8 family phage protein